MIDLAPFLKILPVLLLALMSPGPSFVMVSSLSLSKGRSAGVLCAAGMGACDVVYAALSVLGIELLFEQIPILMIVLKILGGLYLAYIGVLMWRFSLAKKAGPESATPPQPVKQGNPFLLGFFTSLTNPKVIIFFGSIFALALEHGANAPTQIMLPVLCGLTAFGWYGFVAIALSVPKIRARYKQWSTVIDRVAGSVLILFGLKLVLAGIMGW